MSSNKILIPKGNLKIPRRNMPQITSDNLGDLFHWLRTQGVKTKKTTKKAVQLKPSQKEINIKAVEKLITSNPPKLKKPFLISKDGFILDGHHRWLALIHNDINISIDAYEINLKARDALAVLRKYPRATFKDSNNAEYKTPDTNLRMENIDMESIEVGYIIEEIMKKVDEIEVDEMSFSDYKNHIKIVMLEMAKSPSEEPSKSLGSFKEFINEAKNKVYDDPQERFPVRGIGMVKVGDLERMLEIRLKDVDKFRKIKNWGNVLGVLQNSAIMPLLEALKIVKDSQE